MRISLHRGFYLLLSSWCFFAAQVNCIAPMSRVNTIQNILRSCKEASLQVIARYFKVKPGDYGAHDQFLGITMPNLRKIARDYHDLRYEELQTLLQSPYNEERCFALIVMGDVYNKKSTSFEIKDQLCNFYLSQTVHVNNWNLVDNSAYKILGEHLLLTKDGGDIGILLSLANSKNMWERRIAIVSTMAYIRRNQFDPTIIIAQIFFSDTENLIHKATGWLLREMGKKDQGTLKTFLGNYAFKMPRVMLSYAVEKFTPNERFYYRSLTSESSAQLMGDYSLGSIPKSKRNISETGAMDYRSAKKR